MDRFGKLKSHPRVADVEFEGMEDGRFFVHLREDWRFIHGAHELTVSRSFDNVRSALAAVNHAKLLAVSN